MSVTTIDVAIAATETPHQIENATSGFADSTGLFGPVVLVLVYALAVMVAAQWLAPWIAESSLLSRLGAGVVETIVYAIKGLATTAVLAVAALPFWFVSQADPGTRSAAFRYGGYAIVAFVGLVVVGWLADRAVTKFIEAHPDYEEWGDLWHESEDEELTDPEASA